LLAKYKKDPDNFSIQYKRDTNNYWINPEIETNVVKELKMEKDRVENLKQATLFVPILLYEPLFYCLD
jgi:hypothetical protein